MTGERSRPGSLALGVGGSALMGGEAGTGMRISLRAPVVIQSSGQEDAATWAWERVWTISKGSRMFW